MVTHPDYWEEATRYLAGKDEVMAALIARYEGEVLTSRGDPFETLVRAIVGQQISVKAADAVWGRLSAASPMQPEALSKLEDEALRACGLSGQKVKYIRSLSDFFVENDIIPGFWNGMEDAEVIRHVTQVKGIGVWTAEMFLIFCLLRPNVFPVDDLGVLKAIDQHYPHKKPRKKEDYQKLAKQWQPYRTVATWYLWRALDPVAVAY